MKEHDVFTEAYIECLLWSSTDEEGRPLDALYDPEDIDESLMKQIEEDCEAFQKDFGHLFRGNEVRAGHYFWLTRNHHGAGFWDGDWDDETGKTLTEAAHAYGSVDIVVSDGKVCSI